VGAVKGEMDGSETSRDAFTSSADRSLAKVCRIEVGSDSVNDRGSRACSNECDGGGADLCGAGTAGVCAISGETAHGDATSGADGTGRGVGENVWR